MLSTPSEVGLIMMPSTLTSRSRCCHCPWQPMSNASLHWPRISSWIDRQVQTCVTGLNSEHQSPLTSRVHLWASMYCCFGCAATLVAWCLIALWPQAISAFYSPCCIRYTLIDDVHLDVVSLRVLSARDAKIRVFFPLRKIKHVQKHTTLASPSNHCTNMPWPL